jgi:hypothetical protein
MFSLGGLCVLFLAGSFSGSGFPPASATAALPRGVDPAQAAKYSGQTFTCGDNSKTIPIERVNDGYCDCFLGQSGAREC